MMSISKEDKLSFTQLAILAMKQINRPVTTSELWQFVLQNNLHKRLKTFDEATQLFSGQTPHASFGMHIYTDTQYFEVVENTKPKQFRLKNHDYDDKQNANIVAQNREKELLKSAKKAKAKIHFHERKLHDLLAYFLKNHEYFEAHSKTVFHEESLKGQKGEDKWLYPDMVAVNFEYANYQQNNLFQFINKFDILPIKIYSFEIKKELSFGNYFGNYKEYFFQAVSNSSWANEGYLVALDIDTDDRFIEALQKLSLSFGIGIIHLKLDSILQSRIISPARYKDKMDYSVIDELARKNKNFAKFLKTVTDFDIQNTSRYLNEFDKILSDDELNDYLQELQLN